MNRLSLFHVSLALAFIAIVAAPAAAAVTFTDDAATPDLKEAREKVLKTIGHNRDVRDRFQSAETAWIAYRDADCRYETADPAHTDLGAFVDCQTRYGHERAWALNRWTERYQSLLDRSK